MADIKVTCPSCTAVITVSQFADLAAMTCASCGGKLEADITSLPPKKKHALRRAVVGEGARLVSDDVVATTEDWQYVQRATKAKDNRKAMRKLMLPHIFASWGVFLLLGGIMGYARYGGKLSIPQMANLQEYGPYIFLGFHILILLKAMRDSMMQGILCLFVPFYSFYYLFFLSDDFYMRAMMGGILAGITQDSLVFYQKFVIQTFHAIDTWIRSGG